MVVQSEMVVSTCQLPLRCPVRGLTREVRYVVASFGFGIRKTMTSVNSGIIDSSSQLHVLGPMLWPARHWLFVLSIGRTSTRNRKLYSSNCCSHIYHAISRILADKTNLSLTYSWREVTWDAEKKPGGGVFGTKTMTNPMFEIADTP